MGAFHDVAELLACFASSCTAWIFMVSFFCVIGYSVYHINPLLKGSVKRVRLRWSTLQPSLEREFGMPLLLETLQGKYSNQRCSGSITMSNSSFQMETCDTHTVLHPRLAGLCIFHRRAVVCEYNVQSLNLTSIALPNSAHIPFENGVCPPKCFGRKCNHKLARWYPGLHFIADSSYIGTHNQGKGQPMHEAEKLLPYLAAAHSLGMPINMAWFADPTLLTPFTAGLMGAFACNLTSHPQVQHTTANTSYHADRYAACMAHLQKTVFFNRPPNPSSRGICFEDAVVFRGTAAPGEVLLPGSTLSTAFKSRVLEHCGLTPDGGAMWPPHKVVLLNRAPGRRALLHTHELEGLLRTRLPSITNITTYTSGPHDLCTQVAAAATGDMFILPHGSQHAVLLFAPRGAVVVEVQPLQYQSPSTWLARLGQDLVVYDTTSLFVPQNLMSYAYRHLSTEQCRHGSRMCKNHVRAGPVRANLTDINFLIDALNERASGHS